MLNVLITVDTEAWPYSSRVNRDTFLEDVERDIYGTTAEGQFGLRYQIEWLNKYELKAIYFVESLFASAMGDDPLKRVVNDILQGRQDVQLHLHTEWLPRITTNLLPDRRGQHIWMFSEDEQLTLLRHGIENLRRCGAPNITAFRAGNFGADSATLRALARCGILFDTSYNVPWLHSVCHLMTDEVLLQPRPMEGVHELPVSSFFDFGSHYRPTHIVGCSWDEMQHALLGAWRQGWKWFVIVTHSFELVHRSRRRKRKPATADRIAVRRFQSLCQFLGENSDKFRTRSLCDLDPLELQETRKVEPIRSNPFRTGRRMVEQLYRRWEGGQLLGN